MLRASIFVLQGCGRAGPTMSRRVTLPWDSRTNLFTVNVSISAAFIIQYYGDVQVTNRKLCVHSPDRYRSAVKLSIDRISPDPCT